LLIKIQSPNTFSTAIWYQHWWTENMRSTLEISGIWSAMNTNILGQGSALNKQLSAALNSPCQSVLEPGRVYRLWLRICLGTSRDPRQLQGRRIHPPGRDARRILTATQSFVRREPPAVHPSGLDITEGGFLSNNLVGKFRVKF
jgi:hypothetical protein